MRAERLALLDRANCEVPVRTQADLLSLNRSSLYYVPVPPSPAEVAIKHRIDALYTERPFYGVRRMTAQLRRDGLLINHKAVERHMREMGLAGVCPGPKLSKPAPGHRVYPYLLRGMTAQRPNHVWGIDITYIRLTQGWMYLVVFLGLVRTLYRELGVGPNVTATIRDDGRPAGADDGNAQHLEQRPRQSFHQPAVHDAA